MTCYHQYNLENFGSILNALVTQIKRRFNLPKWCYVAGINEVQNLRDNFEINSSQSKQEKHFLISDLKENA